MTTLLDKQFLRLDNETGSEFVDRLLHELSIQQTNVDNSKTTSMPKMYSARHIEPGLVSYEGEQNDYGMVLVQKPLLDKMAASFVGRPVVNEVHRSVSPDKFREQADGVVVKHWYNSADGWYWVDFLVWDKDTQRNIENSGYGVSCAYNVLKAKEAKGEYHNIEYSQEILDGVYDHLAIVSTPRYESARIIFNSKGGAMKLKFWEKEKPKEEPVVNAKEVDLDKAVVELDGKEVSVKEMIEVYNAKNAPVTKMAPETTVEIDGKKVTIAELTETFKNKKMNKKDEDKEGEGKELEEEEEEEKTRKEEKELKQKKNALEAEEKAAAEKESKKKDVENAKKEMDEAVERFEKIKNAAETRKGDFQPAKLTSRRDMAARGYQMFGPVTADKPKGE